MHQRAQNSDYNYFAKEFSTLKHDKYEKREPVYRSKKQVYQCHYSFFTYFKLWMPIERNQLVNGFSSFYNEGVKSFPPSKMQHKAEQCLGSLNFYFGNHGVFVVLDHVTYS